MEEERLLEAAADLGYRLMVCGAEIYRVEESVNRLLRAYGMEQGEVFAIYNCVIVSCVTREGRPLCQMRRVGAHGVDLDRMEAYNDLCRRACREVPPPQEFRAALEEVPRVLAAAYFAGAFAFTLFFGGNLRDGLCGGLCGLLIYGCLQFMERFNANVFFRNIAASAVSALAALLLVGCGLGVNRSWITIGAFMTLTPGIALTNTMRDIMAGDFVAGTSKLVEALLTATAIALGTGLAIGLVRMLGGDV